MASPYGRRDGHNPRLQNMRAHGSFTQPQRHRAQGSGQSQERCKENLVKRRARLIVKGYMQEPGVDFEEVFTPVARMELV